MPGNENQKFVGRLFDCEEPSLPISNQDDCQSFLPAAGNRNNGELYNEGTNGYYWSATLMNYDGHIAYAYSLFFSDDDFYDDDSCLRESGYSVRAVTE